MKILYDLNSSEINDTDFKYNLFSNIAYNLQYVEFLIETLNQIEYTEVLRKQTIKSILLTGFSIIESMLFIAIKQLKLDKKIWEKHEQCYKEIAEINGEKFRVITTIEKEVSIASTERLTFDQMKKRLASKPIFVNYKEYFTDLKRLNDLRNSIHLTKQPDKKTDYFNFNESCLKLTAKAIYNTFFLPVFENNSSVPNLNMDELKVMKILKYYANNQ